jgi:transposase-like protein
MAQTLLVTNVRQAVREVKAFEWEGDYRPAAQQAIKTVLEGAMQAAIRESLAANRAAGLPDRRNGSYPRRVLTEVGDVTVAVARTRAASASHVLGRYRRRRAPVNQAILECFVLGASTRKVGRILRPLLGEAVSAATVSQVAKQLDVHVAAYHRRPLTRRYRFLLFDGVVLKRRSGVGTQKRVVLVALGITAEGRKEVIDFFLAAGESQAAWEAFLHDLYRRGLTGEDVALIVTDGGKGLLAALPLVFPRVPVQRCWAHKTRNVTAKVRARDRAAVKQMLHRISHAPTERRAQQALAAFVRQWAAAYPAAVACLTKDAESLLAFYRIQDPGGGSMIRTTNAIERRFVEVRRRTRPMGAFADRTSMERILFAVFTYENHKEGINAPLLLTQNS